MRRYHLIELHEQDWFPASWRRLFQLGMGRSLSLTGAFDNVTGRFQRFLERLAPDTVLDLCSGSGEAAVHVWQSITSSYEASRRPSLTLSDLYPNISAFSRFKKAYPELIDYYPQPVDALRPPENAPRVRTMFNCLHHFGPNEAREILKAAAENADGIAAFEITRRSWLNILQAALLLPFASAYITAFRIRPVRFENVLWGLLVPVLPIQAAFDGVVSNLRTYTVAELEEITQSIQRPDFEWEIGTVRIPRTPLLATYVLGWRSDRGSDTQ